MKIPSIIILLSFFTCFAFSQNDTTFFNKKWKKCDKSEASYYRLITKTDTDYIVKDFYISGAPQMIAHCSSVKDSLIMDGNCTYYYRNGIIESEGLHTDNKKIGQWMYLNNKGKDTIIDEYSVNGNYKRIKPILKRTASEIYFEKIKNDSSRKYLNFLYFPSAKSQNYLLTFNYQYMLTPWGKTFGAQGCIASLGINLARFFSRKIIFGMTLDVKGFKGISTKKLSNQFVSDFDNDFINTYSNAKDSSNASIVKQSIDGSKQHPLWGNYVGNLGIMVSLFPQKYGGILFQVKRGYRSFVIHDVYGITTINKGQDDIATIDLGDNWAYEITFKPLAFFKNTYIDANSFALESILKNIVVSFYYERLNLRNADFNGTPLSNMVSTDFMNKYGIDNRFGIKLGIGIY